MKSSPLAAMKKAGMKALSTCFPSGSKLDKENLCCVFAVVLCLLLCQKSLIVPQRRGIQEPSSASKPVTWRAPPCSRKESQAPCMQSMGHCPSTLAQWLRPYFCPKALSGKPLQFFSNSQLLHSDRPSNNIPTICTRLQKSRTQRNRTQTVWCYWSVMSICTPHCIIKTLPL